MQLGRIRVTSRGRLSQAERRHRRLNGLCLYCAASAHTVHSCPILHSKRSSPRTPGGVVSSPQGFRVSRLTTPQPFNPSGASFPVTLAWGGQSLTIPAFIDSGADESFIDHQFALKLGIPVSALQRSLPAFALNGHSLGPVTHQAQPLTLTISGDHVESIRPYVTHSPGTPFILGRPWLELHTPHVCWSSGRILSWSSACQVCCLQPALTSAQAECSPARVPSCPRGRRRRRALPDVSCQSPGGDPWRGGPVTYKPSHGIGASLPREGANTAPLSRSLSPRGLPSCLLMPITPPGRHLQSAPDPTRGLPVCSSAPNPHQSMVGKVDSHCSFPSIVVSQFAPC